MRKILIISYDFPPSVAGIWRTLKYCRYLPEYGWKPSILTVKPIRSNSYNFSPLAELPEGTDVRRTESFDPNRMLYRIAAWRGGDPATQQATASTGGAPKAAATPPFLRNAMGLLRRWVFLPDDRALWYYHAVPAAMKWLKEEDFDAIYTTSFPHTSHLVGAAIARKTGLSWLADFRDSWTGNYEFFKPATALHSSIQFRMEKRVIQSADRVVTATEPITRDFIRRYPCQPVKKFHTITNGYDPADYPEVMPEPDPGRFVISYVGTMFGDASPKTFFAAVRFLLKKEPQWRKVLKIRFIGSMIDRYRVLISKAGLEDICTVEGYVPHDEALLAMASADALLLVVPDVPGAEIMLTQKVFEYTAARRPVIGLCPEGAARQFLAEIDEGPIHYPDDVKGTMLSIRKMLMAWEKSGRQELPKNKRLARYHRKALTKRLAGLLDGMVDSQ